MTSRSYIYNVFISTLSPLLRWGLHKKYAVDLNRTSLCNASTCVASPINVVCLAFCSSTAASLMKLTIIHQLITFTIPSIAIYVVKLSTCEKIPYRTMNEQQTATPRLYDRPLDLIRRSYRIKLMKFLIR